MAKVKDFMTGNVISASPRQSVQEVAQIMSRHNIGFVPVVKDNKVLGVITDRDIVLRTSAKGLDTASTRAETIMSGNVITASQHMDIYEAANLMSEHQIRRLPVVDDKNNLLGVVALGDLAVKDMYQDEAGETLGDISEPASPLMQ